MEVTVRFYSLFLAYVPEAEITVKMQKENPTVADLIDELNEKLGEDFSRELGERIKTDPQMLKLIHIGQNNLKMRRRPRYPP